MGRAPIQINRTLAPFEPAGTAFECHSLVEFMVEVGIENDATTEKFSHGATATKPV